MFGKVIIPYAGALKILYRARERAPSRVSLPRARRSFFRALFICHAPATQATTGDTFSSENKLLQRSTQVVISTPSALLVYNRCVHSPSTCIEIHYCERNSVISPCSFTKIKLSDNINEYLEDFPIENEDSMNSTTLV